MPSGKQLRVMIAGIGGASLGTELLKSLLLAGRYEVFGCDVASTAYGLYDPGFVRSFLVDRNDYVDSVLAACAEAGCTCLIPGGEQPMVLLAAAADMIKARGIFLVANDPAVVRTFSNKSDTFRELERLGFTIPRTVALNGPKDLDAVGLPCIVKPATGSGGSAMVFFATDALEAMGYADHIRHSGGTPLAQEYIDPSEGEFTVGVLSLPDSRLIGSIALRRSLESKLSVLSRERGGVVSSGYSQGYIGDFPEVCARAEAIARAVGSRGPLNVQGRVRGGELIPFEINPRLSASTYLRALAGFNEIDLLLRTIIGGETVTPDPLRKGWYLRTLSERFVAAGEILS